MTQPMILTPTGEDYSNLIDGNAQAAAELKAIILTRLLAEKDAELVALQKDRPDGSKSTLVNIKEASGE
jgi:hypothetical protein